MKIVKEMIRQQSVLKEWFEHANRQYTINKDEYKDGFKQEFDNLIENGNNLAQMSKIDSLDLLCDITDGSPQNEYLATELKETWLIHLKEGDINHKLRFFNSLLDNKIISFKEHSEAYHLAHVLNWSMESNAIAGKQALKGAGYYNNMEHKPDNDTPQQEYNEIPDMTADDLLLRTFFGEYLNNFLKEAQTCKDGTAVAHLVNWYINEYNLDKNRKNRKKPLHDALFAKGIIKIGVNGWNKAIK